MPGYVAAMYRQSKAALSSKRVAAAGVIHVPTPAFPPNFSISFNVYGSFWYKSMIVIHVACEIEAVLRWHAGKHCEKTAAKAYTYRSMKDTHKSISLFF